MARDPAARRPQPARRAGGSDSGRQGDGRGTDRADAPRDPPLGIGDDARAAARANSTSEHYYFVDDAEFDRLIAAGELLEHATVHNRFRYGTPRKPIEDALAEGRTVLLEIDLQGARQVRAAEPSATLVFLLPPSWDELVQRLVGRGTEGAEERARRLRTAKVELAAQHEFDFSVVNDDVDRAAEEVVGLTR